MSKQQNEVEFIEQFLEGSLDKEKKRMMEDKISQDEDYAKDFEQYKLLIDGIKYSGRKKLLTKIKKWDLDFSDDFESESKHLVRIPFRWYYAAASIAFFIIAGFLIYSNINSGYDRIVADHYTPYNYNSEIKRGDKIEKNSIEHIFQYYDHGEYIQFIQMINKLEDGQKTEQVNFILANAYQATENYDEAIILYGSIIDSGTSYSTASKWYLALCYLSVDNVAHARLLLEDLKGLTTFYSPKAKNLLEDLN